MTDELLTERQAAAFCGLDFKYFRNLRKTKQGAAYIRPSAHTTLYRKADLEVWVGTWKIFEPKTKGCGASQINE